MKDVPWITTNGRASVWFGHCQYSYSNITHAESPIPSFLQNLISSINSHFDSKFNSVMINYYMGFASLGWHSDDEQIHDNSYILSLSLGSSAVFQLRNKATQEVLSYQLCHGDIIAMGGTCQRDWLHRIKPCYLSQPRVNMTFRCTLGV